jgi:protein-S-isoprenylcysteine O-methyltransferase Ste14
LKKKVIFLYVLDQILSLVAAAVALFFSAGRMNWGAAWAALGVWAVWFTVTDLLLLHFTPDLMAERLSPPKSAKNWDRIILSSIRLLQLARYILAGLDQRFGWTAGFPMSAQVVGLITCAASYALVTWAMVSNPFFSQVIRIQEEREHTVATHGPYRYLRHPGNFGMILFEPGMAVLLGSWWALAVSGLCSILFILRTALEDHTLQVELAGYTDYARQVKYRLIPGVW